MRQLLINSNLCTHDALHVGHHIAIREIDDNNTSKTNMSKMSFIMMPENVQQITCMKLSPNKRFLLVAEQHKDNACCFISVYDLKEASLVAMKVHNISELIEGRNHVHVGVMLDSRNMM